MPISYSSDLRERVIEAVEAGASRRKAAERFDVLSRRVRVPLDSAPALQVGVRYLDGYWSDADAIFNGSPINLGGNDHAEGT
jgi:hypothetical protein